MNKVAIGAVVAVTAIGLGMMPASAGLPPGGRVIVAPDEVEVGGSVVVSNEPEWESTCVPAVLPSAASSGSVVDLEIEDPNGDLIVDEKVIPDGEGNWSYEVTGLTLIGEYTVITWCEYPPSIVAEGFEPAAQPVFRYDDAFFQVIDQAPTSTSTSTTLSPSTSTTSTTAATASVAATPRYTG